MFGGVHQSRGPCHVRRSSQSMIYRLASRLSRHSIISFQLALRHDFAPSESKRQLVDWVLVVRFFLFFSPPPIKYIKCFEISIDSSIALRHLPLSLSLSVLLTTEQRSIHLWLIFLHTCDRLTTQLFSFSLLASSKNRDKVQSMTLNLRFLSKNMSKKNLFEIQLCVLISFTRNGRNFSLPSPMSREI